MRVLIAVDSFKGSLPSAVICRIAQRVLREMQGEFPDLSAICLPVGDGGEGTAEALTFGKKPQVKKALITAKNGRKKTAPYALSEGVAYLNAADCCGIAADNRKEDALLAFTSYGLGELLSSAAADEGVKELVVALGGTGTQDGGAGLLAALGAKFTDAYGRETGYLPADLDRVQAVDLSPALAALSGKPLTVLCDTVAPLTGEGGGVQLFAEQKGASAAGRRYLERALGIFSAAAGRAGALPSDTPSAGAGGGLGYALVCCLSGKPQNGLSYLFEKRDYRATLEECDAVIGGEGFLDATSFTGKAVGELSAMAEAAGKPLYLVCGGVEPFLPLPSCVKGVFPFTDCSPSLGERLLRAKEFCRDQIRAALSAALAEFEK